MRSSSASAPAIELLRAQQGSLDGVADVTVTDIGVDVSYGQVGARDLAEGARADRRPGGGGPQAAPRARVRDRRAGAAHLAPARPHVRDRPGQRRGAAEVIVEVWAAAAGHYTVQVDYIVPGACWRPYHRAQLVELVQGKDPVLHFASEGCVWQNTGEDWTDVQFIFSTERPSLGMEPPQLATDVLHAQRKSEVLVVEAREQEVQTTGLGVAPKQRSAELPGIDDGGEALKLRSRPRRACPATAGRTGCR
jgi:hypothetical protein